jgi:FKBP-type peptidyl-prolyl cis-trans isomerase SlyD
MDPTIEHSIVEAGCKIRIDFTLLDEEHATVQTDKASFEVVMGFGQLLPKIEAVLMGARMGETRTVKLKPREAFGDRDPAKIVEFDRDEFPEDVAPGDHFEAEQEDGGIVVLRVMEVLSDGVVIDLNHPLAGQSVSLALTVMDIRPASQDELETAQSQRKEAEGGRLSNLLAPESLLRGRTER